MSVASSGSIASRRSAASSRGCRRRMAAALAGSSSSRISGISLAGDRLEQNRDLVVVEAKDDIGPVGRTEAIGQAADAELFPLGDQLPNLVDQLVVRHGRSVRCQAGLRFVRSMVVVRLCECWRRGSRPRPRRSVGVAWIVVKHGENSYGRCLLRPSAAGRRYSADNDVVALRATGDAGVAPTAQVKSHP